MLFNSIKEINRLLSKVMSNIYFKVTIEKKWRSENFYFVSLKSLPSGQFLGSRGLGAKLCGILLF